MISVPPRSARLLINLSLPTALATRHIHLGDNAQIASVFMRAFVDETADKSRQAYSAVPGGVTPYSRKRVEKENDAPAQRPIRRQRYFSQVASSAIVDNHLTLTSILYLPLQPLSDPTSQTILDSAPHQLLSESTIRPITKTHTAKSIADLTASGVLRLQGVEDQVTSGTPLRPFSWKISFKGRSREDVYCLVVGGGVRRGQGRLQSSLTPLRNEYFFFFFCDSRSVL